MEKIRKAEWVAAITLTGVVVLLLVVRALNAGGLWRDECGALQLATMPTYGEILTYSPFESFPLLFPVTLRLYTGLLGTSDGVLRAFGLLVGLTLVAVLWWNARLLYGKPPLLSLALIGLNSTFLLWGTAVRGYGLGSVWILLAFGLIEKARREPRLPWMVAALGVSLAGAHSLFYNAVLLSAIGCSVLAVSLLRRESRPALGVAAIGAVCGLSMIPYFGFYSSGSQWNMLVKHEVGMGACGSEFLSALGGDSMLLTGIWIALLVAIAAGAMRGWRSGSTPGKAREAARGCFCYGLFAGIAALAGYSVFLKILGYVPRPWHFLALVVILAAAVEMMAENLPPAASWGWSRVAVVVGATVLLPFIAWPQITRRQTNIDLVAHALDLPPSPQDLIVVTPWYLGVSFHWYYRGMTPWLTLPELADYRTHRYDLLKEKMMASHPIDNIMEQVEKTLKAGRRIWIVGGVDFLAAGQAPAILPPAPNSPYGWADPVYSETWSQQLGAFLQRHARRGEVVRVSTPGPVNEMENVPLWVMEGWRD